MKDALRDLQDKREAFEKMKKNYEDNEAHIQVLFSCFLFEHVINLVDDFQTGVTKVFIPGPSTVCGETDARGV